MNELLINIIAGIIMATCLVVGLIFAIWLITKFWIIAIIILCIGVSLGFLINHLNEY